MLNFSEITNTVKNIIEVRIKIVKEEVMEELKAAALKMAVLASLGFVGFFILLFLSLALAFWLGALTGSTALGFLLAAVFYMIIFGILFAVKDSEKLQFSIQSIFQKFGILFQTKETTPEYTNDITTKQNESNERNGSKEESGRTRADATETA